MKFRIKTVIISLTSVVITAGIIAGAVLLTSSFLDNQYASLHAGCYPRQPQHTIIIENNTVTPAHVDANRCDTLMVKNLDNESRLMAFGVHNKHIAYDGIKEQLLLKGESFTTTMIQTGDFKVHDHEDDDVGATFTVR